MSRIPILFIAYHFPPQGGSGVQRASKFAKYLPKYGITPHILTGDGLMDERWTPEDKSLLSDLREDNPIYRIKWPDYHSRSKQEVDNLKAAIVQKGINIAKTNEIQAILVSMSPFEDSAIASEIANATGLPWIADLRDPWALDEFRIFRSGLHRRQTKQLMRKSLASANCVIMNTPEAATRLKQEFKEFLNKDIDVITNGYDAEDFEKPIRSHLSAINPNKFNIVHTGTFHTARGLQQKKRQLINSLLKKSHPGVESLPRSPYYLLKSLDTLRIKSPQLFEDCNVVFAGASTPEEEEIVNKFNLSDKVTITGYVPHEVSVSYLKSADLLFLPLHHLRPSDRATIVPGKTYEYLASGKPILGAVPEGDARDFLTKAGNNYVCDPKDVSAITQSIETAYAKKVGSTPTASGDKSFTKNFERKELTNRLSAVLHRWTNSN